jgi:hypothetical protein
MLVIVRLAAVARTGASEYVRTACGSTISMTLAQQAGHPSAGEVWQQARRHVP